MNKGYHLILMSYWRTVSDWLVRYLHENNVKKIAYIMNAVKQDFIENPNFVFNDFEMLQNSGFDVEIIDIENVKDFNDVFRNKDLIYVRGGNTFELLNSMKKSGFDKVLCQLLENGIIYAGSSAGSIIPGPNIEIAENDFMPDYNNCGLTDMGALDIIDFAVFPHWKEVWRNDLDKLIKNKKINYKVMTLSDNQTVLIKDGVVKTLNL